MDELDGQSWADPGLRWRTYLSVGMSLEWLAFIALWWLFFGDEYDNYQNLAVTLISLMVMAGVLGAAWLTWARKHDADFRTQVAVPGLWSRVMASVAIFFGLTLAAPYWLWYMAGERAGARGPGTPLFRTRERGPIMSIAIGKYE